MAYPDNIELPTILGPTSGKRAFAQLLRACRTEFHRVSLFGDSWVGPNNATYWLNPLQGMINGILFNSFLTEQWIPIASTWQSGRTTDGYSYQAMYASSGESATDMPSNARWPNSGCRKIAPHVSGGFDVRINRRGGGSRALIGGGAHDRCWPLDADFFFECGVLPNASSGDLRFRWWQKNADGDFGPPNGGWTQVRIDDVSGASTGSDLKILTSPTFTPDWGTANPGCRISSASGSALVDVQWVRLRADVENRVGIGIDPWGHDGYRMGAVVGASFQDQFDEIGPIFQLQGYSGVICALGFNDAIGDTATPETFKARVTNWLAYIRGIAGWDIPVLFMMNAPWSTDVYSSTVWSYFRQYAAAAAEACEEDSVGNCCVLNNGNILAVMGINEYSQNFPLATDFTPEWATGDVEAGDIAYDHDHFGNSSQHSVALTRGFVAYDNHTAASTNAPGTGAAVGGGGLDHWRVIKGMCNQSTSDGIHPSDIGGTYFHAPSIIMGLGMLMGEGGSGGGGGGGGSGRVVSNFIVG